MEVEQLREEVERRREDRKNLNVERQEGEVEQIREEVEQLREDRKNLNDRLRTLEAKGAYIFAGVIAVHVLAGFLGNAENLKCTGARYLLVGMVVISLIFILLMSSIAYDYWNFREKKMRIERRLNMLQPNVEDPPDLLGRLADIALRYHEKFHRVIFLGLFIGAIIFNLAVVYLINRVLSDRDLCSHTKI